MPRGVAMFQRVRALAVSITLALLISFQSVAVLPAPSATTATRAQLESIRKYIRQSWHTLTRSNARLADAAVDPKLHLSAGARWPVYVSRTEDIKEVDLTLRAQMRPGDLAKVELRRMPDQPGEILQHGLLYLPYPYVVPGGRFNEMYGWDSYFIQVDLLRDGETELAKNVADNFLYQIENYVRVLNANRTYYLTRSQPPFITQMVLGVFRKTHDLKWLRSAMPKIEKYYAFWTAEPHLTKETGLSRYFDFGDGPAPEVISDERDENGRTHYDRVKEYYRTHDIKDYDLSQYYLREKDQLTGLFYKGDRSMRESGFDPSNRFGPFNIDIIHYDPVCLNSLLYLMETDTAEILRILGNVRQALVWSNRAQQRRQTVNRLMWDEKDGLYYDYSFTEKRLRRYPFITTFYPLWVGIADKRQAEKIVATFISLRGPAG